MSHSLIINYKKTTLIQMTQTKRNRRHEHLVYEFCKKLLPKYNFFIILMVLLYCFLISIIHSPQLLTTLALLHKSHKCERSDKNDLWLTLRLYWPKYRWPLPFHFMTILRAPPLGSYFVILLWHIYSVFYLVQYEKPWQMQRNCLGYH